MPEWVALHVYTGHELTVAGKCAELPGLATLVPAERPREPSGEPRLYLPGYVLLRWAPTPECYYAIRRMDGVIRFLGDGRPTAIPQEQVDVMEALNRQGHAPPAPTAMRDGRTQIIGGPLVGVPHTILSVNRRAGRAALAVELLGKTHTVRITVDKQPTKDGG